MKLVNNLMIFVVAMIQMSLVKACETVIWDFASPETKPGTVTIQAGDCVVFETMLGVAHNVVEFASKDAYKVCDFTEGEVLQARGAWKSYELTFVDEGTYYYGCSIGRHCSAAYMYVKVVVTNAPHLRH